tara:strand:- start:404 stop:976 length:573 start_codon:yes stop_codon:yes gene_type:complete
MSDDEYDDEYGEGYGDEYGDEDMFSDDEEDIFQGDEVPFQPEFRDERGCEERVGKDALDTIIIAKQKAIEDEISGVFETVKIGDNIIGPFDMDTFRRIFEYNDKVSGNILACMIVSSVRVSNAIQTIITTGDTTEFDIIVDILQGTRTIDGSIQNPPAPPEVIVEHLTGPKGLENIPFILLRYHKKLQES